MSLAQLVERLQQRGQTVNVVAVAANDPAPIPNAASEPAADPETDHPADWRELDAAYLAHHVNCNTCIAASRGVHYGQRCGAGAALWARYSDAVMPALFSRTK